MILLACSQAVVSILIGTVLIQRGRRGWGWALVALGGAILLLVAGSFLFTAITPGR